MLLAFLMWFAFVSVAHGADDDDLDNLTASGPVRVMDTPQAIEQAYGEALRLESSGKFFSAASVFFNIYTAGAAHRTTALGKIAENLIRAKLYNAAAYFFIKTLQSGDPNSIRGVVRYLPVMLDNVGGDVLRKYIIRYTRSEDYDTNTRNHFYYFLAKDELLKGDAQQALGAIAKINTGSGVLAQAMYIKGTALSLTGQLPAAVAAFESCKRIASRSESSVKKFSREVEDLEARCTAGLARTFYQQAHFDRAEETYDDIPKSTFVWTDILFEQAWNAFAKGDYNRTLGKLVTYRSPSLGFVFNPEVDVLRAQTFLNLCYYDDVNKVINEFNGSYGTVGVQIKNFLEQNSSNLPAFYSMAKQVYGSKLHSASMFARAFNRFIRGPYFVSMIEQERASNRESARIRKLAYNETGFGGFLVKVLSWRVKSVSLLGGAYVKNSLLDTYRELLADFDKVSFIKLDMLAKAKSKLEKKTPMSEDEDGVLKRGSASINRRNYQFFWNFNGEFWIDELGDYVFALESECGA